MSNVPETPVLETPKITSKIYEYRIVLPLTVDEYHIGQLYGVAEASKNETGGGEGIEVVVNEPREFILASDPEKETKKSQYTHKVFHLQSKVPRIVRALAPKGSLEMMEIAYNGYPYCRTMYSNPYMKDSFHIDIETKHELGAGENKNIHNLTPDELEKRVIVNIDISNDKCDPRDYKESEDPTKFKSEKTGRGPLLGPDWKMKEQPVMCCYKLYRVYFKWFGLQTKVESMILKNVQRLLFNFHRQVFCWMDKWHGMTIEDIRALEEKTKAELDELRSKGEVRGMTE